MEEAQTSRLHHFKGTHPHAHTHTHTLTRSHTTVFTTPDPTVTRAGQPKSEPQGWTSQLENNTDFRQSSLFLLSFLRYTFKGVFSLSADSSYVFFPLCVRSLTHSSTPDMPSGSFFCPRTSAGTKHTNWRNALPCWDLVGSRNPPLPARQMCLQLADAVLFVVQI